MSLECGECERDLRGPHDPSCSHYKPPARCRICSEKLVEDDFGLYCPTHGASSAEADPYAALQPAPDREALVRLLQTITRNGSIDDGRTLHEVIADAMLASGLRLPAPADPYAALSQHLHGDGDTPTAGGRLIASAAEAAVAAWRTRALAAETEVERLRGLTTEAIQLVENCSVETGVCCCGEDMERHSTPMNCGHTPTDMGAYQSLQWLDAARAALIDTPPQPAPACATLGCTNRPAIRLDDRCLCRGCYATHDFGDDA